MAVKGAAILVPIFEQSGGRRGRLSIQTNPTLYRDAEGMLEQGRRFAGLAPNMQVKFPATAAGLVAIEEATTLGISINATVSFTLPQALAVGAAVERGLDRRTAAGLDTDSMSPVCTVMIGRLDDWVKAVCERDMITLDPAAPNWAGIAVFKKTAALYRERGYRTRLLAAAYRHHLHWSELIGGDVTLTIPYAWQRRFNASSVEVRARFDDPVPAAYLDELVARVPDFVRAFEPDGLAVDEFDTYGATVRTLRGFIASYWELVGRSTGSCCPTRTFETPPDPAGGRRRSPGHAGVEIARANPWCIDLELVRPAWQGGPTGQGEERDGPRPGTWQAVVGVDRLAAQGGHQGRHPGECLACPVKVDCADLGRRVDAREGDPKVENPPGRQRHGEAVPGNCL